MDLGIIVGIIACLAVLYHAVGGSLAFCDVTGLLVVVVGGLGATLVAFPIGEVLRFHRVKLVALFRRPQSPQALAERIVSFAEAARREGILVLEKALKADDDPFLAGGVRLAVDGTEPDLILDILQTELQFIEARHRRNHRILEVFGRNVVIFGCLGSLIALGVHAGEPASLWLPPVVSPTVFGLLLAGLGAWPLRHKLVAMAESEALCKRLVIEGVMSIQAGDNPRIVEHKLAVFLAPRLRPSGEHQVEPAVPPRPPYNLDDESGAKELSAYVAERTAAIVQQVRAAVAQAAVAEDVRARIESLIERTERGEMAPAALLARLSPQLQDPVFHALANPAQPLIDEGDSDTLFEELVGLSDRQVQMLLREVNQRDLVIALRGATPALRKKLLENMSERVRTFIVEQMSYLRTDQAGIFEKQVHIVQKYRRLLGMGRMSDS